jgi:hypothetical protein
MDRIRFFHQSHLLEVEEEAEHRCLGLLFIIQHYLVVLVVAVMDMEHLLHHPQLQVLLEHQDKEMREEAPQELRLMQALVEEDLVV